MAQQFMYDAFLHTKTEQEDGSGIKEETAFPITRWDHILGRPKRIDISNINEMVGGDYFFIDRKPILLPDEVFKAVYPEFEF